MTYKVEVIADGSGKWCGNGMVFNTVQDAKDYAADLGWRWTAVRSWRVIDDKGAVIYPIVAPTSTREHYSASERAAIKGAGRGRLLD